MRSLVGEKQAHHRKNSMIWSMMTPRCFQAWFSVFNQHYMVCSILLCALSRDVPGLFTGSPLYYAARDDRLATAKVLLRAGADPARGISLAGGLIPALDSPSAVALQLHHNAMAKLLEESERKWTKGTVAGVDSVHGYMETAQTEQEHEVTMGGLHKERELRRRSI